MSISSTISNALSGLNVASRSADVVSSNIANSLSEGYGVRRLDIAARTVGSEGSGARVAGVNRHENVVLIADRRNAEAELGGQTSRSEYLSRIESLIGTPDQTGSLSARVANFEATLVTAANNPHNETNLSSVVDAASGVARHINTIADGIQTERLNADRKIGQSVDVLNSTLKNLEELNVRIRHVESSGRDVSALMDQQSVLLNDLAPLISMQTRRDNNGALQIYSDGGQALLDRKAAVFEFRSVGVMSATMSPSNGALSELTLNGKPLDMSGNRAAFASGELSSLFALRDEWGVAAQADIDAVARDLASRFDGNGLDPTLVPGDAGVFTDGGTAVDGANETGLAARITVNALVDPAAGGEVWRIRDGLGAIAPGPIGNGSFLHRQISAMSALSSPLSGSFSSAERSFAGLVNDHLSGAGAARQWAEREQVHTNARLNLFQQEELSHGVDTDAELQRLLQVEQMFAANARVMNVAQEMIDELMRIG